MIITSGKHASSGTFVDLEHSSSPCHSVRRNRSDLTELQAFLQLVSFVSLGGSWFPYFQAGLLDG